MFPIYSSSGLFEEAIKLDTLRRYEDIVFKELTHKSGSPPIYGYWHWYSEKESGYTGHFQIINDGIEYSHPRVTIKDLISLEIDPSGRPRKYYGDAYEYLLWDEVSYEQRLQRLIKELERRSHLLSEIKDPKTSYS